MESKETPPPNPNESSESVYKDAMDTAKSPDVEEPGPLNGSAEPVGESPTVSSSISVDSRTSTLKYDQEPFDQYRVRVKKLCQVLWPAESRAADPGRRMSGTAKSRILDAVRVKRIRKAFFPSSEKDFIIERMSGGTYNRIIGITVKDPGTKDPEKVILRAPRPQMAFFGYIEREVAILRYVRQKTNLPVADIISFDPTMNNPLESGYVVQSRLPGVSLHSIWDELTHEQRCTIAQDIGEFILALQNVTNSTPGIVEAGSANGGAQEFSIRPFDIKSPYDDKWKSKIPPRISNEGDDATNRNPKMWFGTQFGRWFAHELLKSPSQILYWDYQHQFAQVAKQMDSLDILGDGQNCLCHFDLAARNVLVQILPNGSVTISGIVDWDSAAFAPKFVSCAPPSWLWTDQKYFDVEESEAIGTPSSPEQQEIKKAFDDVVGFDWTLLAYRAEYRLARELFYFARFGLQDGEAQKRAVRLLKEWKTLYESWMNPNKDEDSIKSIPSKGGSQRSEAISGMDDDVAAQ